MAFNFIRHLVSGDKTRLQEDEYDLDFTYITPRIIAMAIPGVGMESAYRNNIQLVAQYLNSRHNGHYRVFNLCAEREYSTDLFNPGSVTNQYGFPDHHNPPLEMLMEMCININSFLNTHPANVIVIHCLAGRGRTGTVIASYLTFSGLFDNGSEALEHFARKRSMVHRGVQQPSQRRYVQYFSEILAGRKPKHYAKSIMLKQIVMYTIPKFGKNHTCQPVLEIFTAPTRQKPKRLLYSSLESRKDFDPETNEPRAYSVKDGTMTFDIGVELQGDIYMRCYHFTNRAMLDKMNSTCHHPELAVEMKEMAKERERLAEEYIDVENGGGGGKKQKKQKKKKEEEPGKFMFRVSFHTGFVPRPTNSNHSIVRMTKTEIDDAIKSSKFDKDFFMDLVWERIPEKEDVEAKRRKKSMTLKELEEEVPESEKVPQNYDDFLIEPYDMD